MRVNVHKKFLKRRPVTTKVQRRLQQGPEKYSSRGRGSDDQENPNWGAAQDCQKKERRYTRDYCREKERRSTGNSDEPSREGKALGGRD